ncbi:MAG: RNA degradosome polyphosphate kinase, partial [Proteobacteria bacterium]|nr:RNA degradosome polyphosphate kinase [Pseudomonadota bacterium]
MNAEKLRKLNHESQYDHYFNRELSWLEFNQRVLEESRRSRTPLLERTKFLAICYANLDEFFMVRVANKKKYLRQGSLPSDSPDRLSVSETLRLIHLRAKRLVAEIGETWNGLIQPDLCDSGIKILSFKQLNAIQKEAASHYYRQTVLPVLTPLAFDPAHPWPFLANRRLYLLVVFKHPHDDLNLAP